MAMKFVGQDIGFIHGVPARDLTDEEEKHFGRLIKQEEKASGLHLYESDEPKVKATPAKPALEKENG